MSAFLSKLVVEDAGGFPFQLVMPLIYDSDRLNRRVVAPAGMQTDYASIPRPLWAILPPCGKYDAPAVLHDWAYQTGYLTRAEADALLREAMVVCGVPSWQVYAIYVGVRLGGRGVYARHRAHDTRADTA